MRESEGDAKVFALVLRRIHKTTKIWLHEFRAALTFGVQTYLEIELQYSRYTFH